MNQPRLACRRVFLRNNFRTFEPGFADDGKRTCVDVLVSPLLPGSCTAHKVCTAHKGIPLLCGSRPGRCRAGLEIDLSVEDKRYLSHSHCHADYHPRNSSPPNPASVPTVSFIRARASRSLLAFTSVLSSSERRYSDCPGSTHFGSGSQYRSRSWT